MEEYRDLLITEDDLTPDAGGIPEMVTGRASIAQDIVHMIRESGLLTEMLANRDPMKRKSCLIKISIAVDDGDQRVRTGGLLAHGANGTLRGAVPCSGGVNVGVRTDF